MPAGDGAGDGGPNGDLWHGLPGGSLIPGGLGRGKTLTAVAFARYYQRTLARPVYANFWLAFPHVQVRCVDDLKRVRGGLLVLDESFLVADARLSMTYQNRVVNRIVTESRKRSFDWILISQTLNRIDVRLREVAARLLAPNIVRWEGKVPSMLIIEVRSPPADFDHRTDPLNWFPRARYPVRVTADLLNSYRTHEPVYDFTRLTPDAKAKPPKGEVQDWRARDAMVRMVRNLQREKKLNISEAAAAAGLPVRTFYEWERQSRQASRLREDSPLPSTPEPGPAGAQAEGE